MIYLGLTFALFGVISMMILITTLEGQDGIGRTNWANVFILAGLIFFGLIIANQALTAGRRAGICRSRRCIVDLKCVLIQDASGPLSRNY